MGTVHSLASAELIIGMGHMCFCFFVRAVFGAKVYSFLRATGGASPLWARGRCGETSLLFFSG